MQEQLYEMLINKDEITWQTLIYELVRTEQMDPWDINVSLLTKRYLETLKELKQTNFFISGKVLLAAAILLKLKSNKLLLGDLVSFDNILFGREEQDSLESPEDFIEQPMINPPDLAIKTPQARKSKVSLNDLMGALQKALEVDKRRTIREMREQEIGPPVIEEKKIDITVIIKDLYSRIKDFFAKTKERLTFTRLVNSEKKGDKILTFISLLHLANQQKVNLAQEEHFGEIDIFMAG